MGAKLVANELKGKAIVGILHPGFNKTGMTSKYSHIWEIEAPWTRVSVRSACFTGEHSISRGVWKIHNCEDGLEIPW